MKEAMRSYSSCCSALNGEITLICISHTIRHYNCHLRAPKSKSFVKELQIHSLKIVYSKCVLWVNSSGTLRQSGGWKKKTQRSGNRVVQFIFAIFAKNNYLSIMWMWFICLKSSTLCNKYFFWSRNEDHCLEKTIHNCVPNKMFQLHQSQYNKISVKIWLNILSTTIFIHWHQCGIFS